MYILNAKQAYKLVKLYPISSDNKICGKIPENIGIHGMIIDTCCPKSLSIDSKYVLCERIQKANHVYVYDSNMRKFKLSKEDIVKLSESFKEDLNLAIKYYPNYKKGYEEMEEDINNGKIVSKLYSKNRDMTTLFTKKFNNFNIVGLYVSGYYYYLNNKCEKTLDKIEFNESSLNKMIDDVLKSIKILHENYYIHGDIKAQNIMLCGDTYKLIDWGRLHSIKNFEKDYKYGGSLQAGSPLGFYLMFRKLSGHILSQKMSAKLALALFEGKIPFFKSKSPLFSYKEFEPVWGNIKEHFLSLFDNELKDEELFKEYKYTLDLYNFGLTLYYMIYKNKIENPKFLKLAVELTTKKTILS